MTNFSITLRISVKQLRTMVLLLNMTINVSVQSNTKLNNKKGKIGASTCEAKIV